jgi:MFS family permease
VHDHPKHKLPEVDNIPEPDWGILFQDLKEIVTSYKFLINGLIGCVLYLPISVFAGLWAIPFLEQAGQLPHKTASTLSPLIFLGMALGGPLASIISESLGRRKALYQISLFIGAILMLAVIYYPSYNHIISIPCLGVILFLIGFFAGSQILVFAVSIELSKKEAAGTATAVTNFIVMISLIFITPLIGKLLVNSWDGTFYNNLAIYSVEGYQKALILIPVLYCAALVLSHFLPDTHPKAAIRRLVRDEELLVLKK